MPLRAHDVGQEAEFRHINKPREHLPSYTVAAVGKHQIIEDRNARLKGVLAISSIFSSPYRWRHRPEKRRDLSKLIKFE